MLRTAAALCTVAMVTAGTTISQQHATAAPPPLKPHFPFSWDKISTYAFPGDLVDTNFTDAEVAHYSKFTLLLYWGVDLHPEGGHRFVPDQEAKSLAQAAKFKAANPDILLFPYITGFLAQNSFKAQQAFNQPEHSDWWLRDPISNAPLDCNQTTANPVGLAPGHGTCFGWSQGFPGKLYDWRIAAVRDYWTNEVIGPYVDSPLIAGIFMDDTTDVAAWCMEPPHGFICQGNWTFTKAQQLDFLNATLQHLDEALDSMNARGKTAIVSTKATEFSKPLNSSVFSGLVRQHGSIQFMESYGGSEDDVQTALKLTSSGTAFMVHSTCGTPDDHIYPFSEKVAPLGVSREYCLAAFLIAAGEYSYWSNGAGWGATNFPWFPEFDRPLGAPLSDATSYGNGKYYREFEHLNVTVDTTAKNGTIMWHGLGPVPTPPSPPAPGPAPAPPPSQCDYLAWGLICKPTPANVSDCMACCETHKAQLFAIGCVGPNVWPNYCAGKIPGPPAPPAPPPPAPPAPPPPPFGPIGQYTGVLKDWIIHQNPPTYNLTRSIHCATAQTFAGCALEASKACDSTAGCTAFSVISEAYNGRVFAELGPLALKTGEQSAYWTSWQKPNATPGVWE